jgi:rubrerythrin
MSQLLESLTEQRKLEMRNVAGLSSIRERVRNDFIKTILEIVVHDSRKHMAVCDALIEMESKAGEVSPPPELEAVLREELERHIELESEMVQQLERLRFTGDIKINSLVEYLISEERRHHRLLTGLLDLIESEEDRLEEYYKLGDRLLVESHQPAKSP